MEDMVSLWSYQENIDDLKQKLMCTTFELELVRVEASEEMRKNKENMKQLLQLLKNAYQERDEANEQIHKLLNNNNNNNNNLIPYPNSSTSPTEFFPTQFQPESPLLLNPTKSNSAITESSTPSETYNGSSSINSLFEVVSSPELTNMAYLNKNPDQDSVVIDNLVKGKALPRKGKFLQAVLEAGPLLQTLLVAGPLPRWRNPPPAQTLQIPPVSMIRGGGYEDYGEIGMQKSYVEMSCGSSQMMSTSMLSFGGSESPFDGNVTSANSFIPTVKRQRFC